MKRNKEKNKNNGTHHPIEIMSMRRASHKLIVSGWQYVIRFVNVVHRVCNYLLFHRTLFVIR